MTQNILNFKKRIDSGEIIFESDYNYFVTKKIFLLNNGSDEKYHVKIEYAVNNSMRPIRESSQTFNNFEAAYNNYFNINITHNLYTPAGKAKIEEDKNTTNEISNEVGGFVDINSIVIPETGKTYRQTNLEKKHNIPIGSLVELENGVRLFVVGHPRDCDETPLYNMCFDKNWKEEENYTVDGKIIPAKMMSRKMLVMHCPEESLTVIKLPEETPVEY